MQVILKLNIKIKLVIVLILKQHLKCQSKFNKPGKAVRFSIDSQASSPI